MAIRWRLAASAAIVGLAASPAIGGTIYSAELFTSLTINTPVVANTFGFGVVNPVTRGDDGGFGNFTANHLATTMSGLGTISQHVFAVGTTAGGPGSLDFSYAWAEASHSFVIGNLTGSGPPTPAGMELEIEFTVTAFGIVDAFADDLLCEVAGALIHWEVLVSGGILVTPNGLTTDTAEVVANGTDGLNQQLTFKVPLAANSTRRVTLHTWAVGYGISDCPPIPIPPPPPIPLDPPPFFEPYYAPEPSTWMSASLGVAGMIAVAWRRRGASRGLKVGSEGCRVRSRAGRGTERRVAGA